MRFVIALTLGARRRRLAGHLTEILEHADGVQIVAGRGRNAVTVEMPENLREGLQRKIDFATIEPARELRLLGD